jgi:cbb3-type cytochrome oxidase maturation protein
MNILLFTLAVSIFLALAFLIGFIWATKKGQYDDLVTPSYRMLIDEEDEKYLDDKKKEDSEDARRS